MENIKQALERARELKIDDLERRDPISAPIMPMHVTAGDVLAREVALNFAHLEANRIIAHDEKDPRSRAFDMLRTQVLQWMDKKKWRILGITSPTQGCGKTVTSVNLALSIARQPERSALLLDLDLQRPRVAACLGVTCDRGVTATLEGRTRLSDAVIQACAGGCSTLVLPAENSASDSSAWMTSRALSVMLQDIKQEYSAPIVIVDLPPMLLADDVIAVLPQLDCILLVAAAGKTKLAEIEECKRHLPSAEAVRLVLNKAPGVEAAYYNYYSHPTGRPAR